MSSGEYVSMNRATGNLLERPQQTATRTVSSGTRVWGLDNVFEQFHPEPILPCQPILMRNVVKRFTTTEALIGEIL